MSIHWGDRRKVEMSPLKRAFDRLAEGFRPVVEDESAAPRVPATRPAAAGSSSVPGRRTTLRGLWSESSR